MSASGPSLAAILVLLVATIPSGFAQNITRATARSGSQVIEADINHKGQNTERDSDGDGISDVRESQLGTNPNSVDTDGDGMTDGVEAAYGSNPLVQNAALDVVYRVTKLPVPAGYIGAEITDIGNGDFATGYAYPDTGPDLAVRWNLRTGGVEVADGADYAYPRAVNDSGVVAGQYDSQGGFRWLPAQTLQLIGAPFQTFSAWDVNSAGDVVGEAYKTAPSDTGAFLLKAGSTALSHLATLPEYAVARAIGINDKGQVGGMVYSPSANKVSSVIWNNGTPTLLEVLGSNNRGRNFVYGIAENGTVFGIKDRKARIWPQAGGTQILPTTAAEVNSYPWKMTGTGEIIGEMNGNSVIWRPDGQGGWTIVDINSSILDADPDVRTEFYAYSMNDQGQIAGGYYSYENFEYHPVILTPMLRPSLAVDANRDGTIASEDATDVTSADKPYRFWPNDDFDRYGASSPPANGAISDHARETVGTGDDFKDFFPVYLNIKQLVASLPPLSGSGIVYKIKQADEAVKFFYTALTKEQAFTFRSSPNIYLEANIHQITREGYILDREFLLHIRDDNQGVILVEGTKATDQPLVLTVEKDGTVLAEISLPLSIGQDIVLLLHGMNSNTGTWQQFVDSQFPSFAGLGAPIVADIRDGDIWGNTRRNSAGVVCYRVQFGAYDLASPRVGLEGVKATDPGYDTVTSRCGDFETFEELGNEVEDAITLLRARHKNTRIVVVGHSRGGLAARAFLQGADSTEDKVAAKAVVVGLLTTSSPHLGSRMGRIYGWLNTHQLGFPETDVNDWEVVNFLLGVGVPWAVLPESLDVRRPVILDVADNSQAIADLNSATALQNIPTSIRCTEIQYANARFGLLNREPFRYSVFEPTGFLGGPLPQMSEAAREFILAGGDLGGIAFIGDGLIPRANQRFTQLNGFPAVALPARIITGREVVHIEAPKQSVDLVAQLKIIAPEMFP